MHFKKERKGNVDHPRTTKGEKRDPQLKKCCLGGNKNKTQTRHTF